MSQMVENLNREALRLLRDKIDTAKYALCPPYCPDEHAGAAHVVEAIEAAS